MKTVLVLSAFYIPGFKAGGPLRTIQGMINILGDEIKFNIITRDRDFMDSKPYPGIKINTWQKIGNAEVLYLSPCASISLIGMYKAICSRPYDILYINSFFDPRFAIVPIFLHRLHLIPNTVILLAPRGEFSKGAISLKKFKKVSYIYLAKVLKLYKKIFWHASSLYEKIDIEREFAQRGLFLMNKISSDDISLNNGTDNKNILIANDLSKNHNIQIATNLFEATSFTQRKHEIISLTNDLKIIFLSRITNKKNLTFALTILSKIKYNIIFDIYGPNDQDKKYWTECQKIISKLPKNIKAIYHGNIEHERVYDIFFNYHLFFFPTKGENFGHVILESLLAGCPVLISDQTPWQDLEEFGAGWMFSLDKPTDFSNIINKLCQQSDNELNIYRKRAVEYGIKQLSNTDYIKQNRDLFSIG